MIKFDELQEQIQKHQREVFENVSKGALAAYHALGCLSDERKKLLGDLRDARTERDSLKRLLGKQTKKTPEATAPMRAIDLKTLVCEFVSVQARAWEGDGTKGIDHALDARRVVNEAIDAIFAERDAFKRLLEEQTIAIELLLRTPPTKWYVNDPEEGIQTYDTGLEAQAVCEALLADYASDAADGWHENIQQLSWGALIAHGQVHEVNRIDAEDDPENLLGLPEKGWAYQCSYELHDVAGVPPPTPTAEEAAAMAVKVEP